MSGQSATATQAEPVAPAPAAVVAATPVAVPAAVAAPAVQAAVAAPVAVPAEISLALPKDSPLDAAHVDGLKAFAKEHGLSQAQAAKLLERDATMAASLPQRFERMDAERLQAAQTKWESDALADPTLGAGDKAKLASVIEVAKKPLAKFATPAFRDFLESTKMGSHPVLLNFLHAIGQSMAEDSPTNSTAGNGGGPREPKTLAEALYTPKRG